MAQAKEAEAPTLEALLAAAQARLGAAPSGRAGKKARQRISKQVAALQREMAVRDALVSDCCLLEGRRSDAAAASPDTCFEMASVGCHVAHLDAAWLVGVEPLEPGQFGDDVDLADVQEISLDPESGLLSLVNTDAAVRKCFNVTVGGTCLPATDAHGQPLAEGIAHDESGAALRCVSFVVLVAPMHLVDVCFLADMPSVVECHAAKGFLVSDVKAAPPVELAPLEQLRAAPELAFPLGGRGPFRCSQSVGGELTHFFASNLYAVDFDCPVGTPVLAVAPGTVVDVRDTERVEGILTSNLFRWNSITVKLDVDEVKAHASVGVDELFVEYVHIRAGSAVVRVGDSVATGDLLCESGNVGFSPRPHLHLQLAASTAPDAPSLPLRLRCLPADPSLPERAQPRQACVVVPRAGMHYRHETQHELAGAASEKPGADATTAGVQVPPAPSPAAPPAVAGTSLPMS